MIHERFKTYFQDTFFKDKPEEFRDFLTALEQGIPRTIRIHHAYISEVKSRLEKDGWILSATPVAGVYSLDRTPDFNPHERRIGYSVDHLVGNFYIQELAAAHPVSILAEGKIQESEFLILDMASSPGGKTTQLAEYYPNSFIVANEPTRERIPQLLQNLDRMGSANIGVTLYGGQYWKNYGEVFDRILLDAPCSGEGTLYKGTDATKHWHIKNIKTIAKLQEKLLEASLHALKVGGEMVYSTCSLNLMENEGVIESMIRKYPGIFKVTFEKKFWPHIDKTGGFFVVKIQKNTSIPMKEQTQRIENTNKELRKSNIHLSNWNVKENITLYEHTGKLLAVRNAGLCEPLRNSAFFMRYGEYIGQKEGGIFHPIASAYRYLDVSGIRKHQLQNDLELDEYLRGKPLELNLDDGQIVIEYEGIILSLETIHHGIIENIFPTDWQRK
ncbi:RsmB/NOP family class I SAM-dependent RNA methyltransferase [Candidatus Gracilibacteria bacterium]|nr:RsmB/NOP family class I SAM-dependent RNA methyltransferase [Candidatus Gracilibacteria bacterium]